MRHEHETDGVDDLGLSIDRDAEVPIGLQLAWGLRSRIQDGSFATGQRLPGLREVAEASGVNINTVRAVYQRLNHEGLINSLQGSGTFVAATQRPRSNVAAIAANAASEARETGVDPREVAAAIYAAREGPARPADQAATRRRRLREQIAALERTLVELEAKHPGVAPPCAKTRQGIGPVVLEAAELERVRTDIVRRLATVQAAIDRQGSEDAAAKKGSRAAPARKPATRRGPSARPAPAGA